MGEASGLVGVLEALGDFREEGLLLRAGDTFTAFAGDFTGDFVGAVLLEGDLERALKGLLLALRSSAYGTYVPRHLLQLLSS